MVPLSDTGPLFELCAGDLGAEHDGSADREDHNAMPERKEETNEHRALASRDELACDPVDCCDMVSVDAMPAAKAVGQQAERGDRRW